MGFKAGDIVIITEKCYCGHKACVLKLNLITSFVEYKNADKRANCRVVAPDNWGAINFHDKLLKRANEREQFLYHLYGPHVLEKEI